MCISVGREEACLRRERPEDVEVVQQLLAVPEVQLEKELELLELEF